jgi:serine/threonine-protein kinase RsbW
MTDGPVAEGAMQDGAMHDGTVRLTMPARAEYLILARLALAGIAREVAMSEEALADLKLAVTEACGNAVRHAYPVEGLGEPGTVRVVYEVGADAIEITVEDEGTGVELEELPDDPLSGEDPAESGMGLAIIRAVMDELVVRERPDGGGTLVRMRKRLA